MNKSYVMIILSLLFFAAPVLAHDGDHGGSFLSGLIHPFTGLDHMVVLSLLGIWFATLSNKLAMKSWMATVVVFFIAVLAGGELLPRQIEMAEWLILASAITAGILVVTKARVYVFAPLVAACIIAGHGIAHGGSASGSIISFALGASFAVGTLVSCCFLASRLISRRYILLKKRA